MLGLAACWQDDGGLSSNPLGCTEIGCLNRLDVIFESQDSETFPPGTYTFTLTPKGEDPFVVACLMGSDRNLDCSGDTTVMEVKAAAREFNIRLSFAPISITVALVFEQQTLGEKNLSPNYYLVTPNGPECAPICYQATIAIEVICPQ